MGQRAKTPPVDKMFYFQYNVYTLLTKWLTVHAQDSRVYYTAANAEKVSSEPAKLYANKPFPYTTLLRFQCI